MIGDVVAVIAVRPRAEKWRAVNVGDSELLQVRDDFSCVFEGEMSVELQSISCNGYAASRCHFLFLLSLFAVKKLPDPGFYAVSLICLVAFAENDQLGLGQHELFLLRIEETRPLSSIDRLVGRDDKVPVSSCPGTNLLISHFHDRLICQ